jgi:hypothetical protein
VIDIYEESGISGFDSKHVVGYLKNTMDKYTDDGCRPMMANFLNYMKSLDRQRGTDWTKTFPDVYKLITDFYN